jgi:transaldolase/glucose-6-phosphate isomerase
MNPLKALREHHGQSPWLDYIRRSLVTSGELQRLIKDDGLCGLTSNPAIFEKAILGSTDYSDLLGELRQKHSDAQEIYEALALADIRDAADLLLPVYEKTKRRDGYVSLEVSPFIACETEATIKEARRLWAAVERPNLMIKVPATPEGIPAIQQLISEGINVNVTLLFSQAVYAEVAEAYVRGLETFAAKGGEVRRVASVASFFISRIDTLVDSLLEQKLNATTNAEPRALLKSLLGKVAIANAKLTYQRYKQVFRGPRWQALEEKGAQTQRLLWASTSTKNPKYRDVLYVEELIGPDTVNTLPPSTWDAFRDHGRLQPSLEQDLDEAYDRLEALARVGIDFKEVTDRLLEDALRLFAEPFDKLLAALDVKCLVPPKPLLQRQTHALPPELEAAVKKSFDDWRVRGKVRRLWKRDAALWTGNGESDWLGWLSITDDQRGHLDELTKFAEEIRAEGFTHLLVLGMGGSSLAPEVLKKTFGKLDGFPELHVLDSTDPQQVRAFEAKIDLARTLFLVSSKSGSTIEPNLFKQYFFERVRQVVGPQEVGRRFVAITDPATRMEKVAKSDRFRHIFYGAPTIGGRFSALSDFGLVPAALMGLDVRKFLDRTEDMVHCCSYCLPVDQNPGVILGTILGVSAKKGRDKVTFVMSPGIASLGAWLEQLLAESTGKQGRGLIPVDGERLGPPEVYGADRLFVYLRLASAPDATQDAAVAALAAAGLPVVRLTVGDPYDLGQEFFRWEVATAVAGSILGVNPFDQPDVDQSKFTTKELIAQYQQTGSLPAEAPFLEEAGLKLFADERNQAALSKAARQERTLAGYLRALLKQLKADDYFALLAYVEMNAPNEAALHAIRHLVRDKKHVATCLGFGPRFLHSTGQAYKGGPNSGVFLQITCDDADDLLVPGAGYTFGVVKAAQARGDFQVLAERGRRAIRVHLADARSGLEQLWKAIDDALAK